MFLEKSCMDFSRFGIPCMDFSRHADRIFPVAWFARHNDWIFSLVWQMWSSFMDFCENFHVKFEHKNMFFVNKQPCSLKKIAAARLVIIRFVTNRFKFPQFKRLRRTILGNNQQKLQHAVDANSNQAVRKYQKIACGTQQLNPKYTLLSWLKKKNPRRRCEKISEK